MTDNSEQLYKAEFAPKIKKYLSRVSGPPSNQKLRDLRYKFTYHTKINNKSGCLILDDIENYELLRCEPYKK